MYAFAVYVGILQQLTAKRREPRAICDWCATATTGTPHTDCRTHGLPDTNDYKPKLLAAPKAATLTHSRRSGARHATQQRHVLTSCCVHHTCCRPLSPYSACLRCTCLRPCTSASHTTFPTLAAPTLQKALPPPPRAPCIPPLPPTDPAVRPPVLTPRPCCCADCANDLAAPAATSAPTTVMSWRASAFGAGGDNGREWPTAGSAVMSGQVGGPCPPLTQPSPRPPPTRQRCCGSRTTVRPGDRP